jgi:methyltransferase (TIGR00027 family)
VKKGRASRTASQVAFLRALADLGLSSTPGFHDATARPLLDGPWSWMLGRIARRVERGKFKATDGLRHGADLLALRTMVIDEHLREALGAEVRQLVILGAGLDGRAYRMTELARVRVFEVDHPATQQAKRRRAAALLATAQALTFVPVDFENDSLDAALQKAGHSRAEPTVWLWEGVVMYLTAPAIRETLRMIVARSAPGSALVVNYMTPSRRRRAIRLLLRLWNEPLISHHTPQAMADELSRAGLHVTADSGVPDWARRFGAEPRQFSWTPGLRVVAARV